MYVAWAYYLLLFLFFFSFFLFFSFLFFFKLFATRLINWNGKSNKDGGVNLTPTLCQIFFCVTQFKKEDTCILITRQDIGNTEIEFLPRERKATAVPDMTYQDSLVVSTAVSHLLAIFGLLERPFWTQASLLCSCESVKKGCSTDLMVVQTTSFASLAWLDIMI